MMVIGAFAPLLIIFLVIMLSFVFVKRSKRLNRVFLRGSKGKWILGMYVLTLLSSVVLLLILQSLNVVEFTKPADIKKAMEAESELMDAAFNLELNEISDEYIRKVWDFDYDEEEIVVSLRDADFNPIMIMAERKDTNDGKIEVVHYATQTVVEDIDVSDRLKGPHVELEDNTLKVSLPANEIKLVKTTKDFTISQFTGAKPIFDGGANIVTGSKLLFLKIPKDLEVIGNVQIVNQ